MDATIGRPAAWRFQVAAVAVLWGGLCSLATAQSGWSQSATAKDDPVSLQSKGEPGIDLYLAVARFHEEAGQFAEADAHYKKARKAAPDNLRVLLAYARFKDHVGTPREAQLLYEEAAKAHPREPAVFNDAAVHFARRGMTREALATLERAIRLRPGEPRYRNNMAALLVETGRPQEAFMQLRAVYDEPVAHYNLGYLLNKKGLSRAATDEFALAWRMNPRLLAARQWLDRLAAPSWAQRGPGGGTLPEPEGPRLASRPPPQRFDAPPGPREFQPVVPEPPAIEMLPPPPPSPPGDMRGVAADPRPPAEPDPNATQRLPPVSPSPPPVPAPAGSTGPAPAESEAQPYWPRQR